MSNVALRRLSVGIAGLVAVLATVSSLLSLRTSSTTWTPLPAPQHLVSDLPPALQASLSRQGVTLVVALAADIDADGDLDIVGSDDRFGVIVLVNDGEGHFSSRRAKRGSWSAEPPDPVWHERGAAPIVSLQNERPPVTPGLAITFAISAPLTTVGAAARRGPVAAVPTTRPPRAPPLVLHA